MKAQNFLNISIFILLIFMGLFSCQDSNKKQFLEEINQMQAQLNEFDSLANKHRVDTLNLIINEIKQRTKEVAEVYSPDTIDYEIAEMMNAYKESRKALSSNSGNLAKVRQSIPEVRLALENLAHDIEHGIGPREKYEEFILFEGGKLHQIEEILNYYIETKEKYMQMYQENNVKVIAFIEELKASN